MYKKISSNFLKLSVIFYLGLFSQLSHAANIFGMGDEKVFSGPTGDSHTCAVMSYVKGQTGIFWFLGVVFVASVGFLLFGGSNEQILKHSARILAALSVAAIIVGYIGSLTC